MGPGRLTDGSEGALFLKIVADENIPYVREAFSTIGDVVTVHGRSMTSATVRDADLLLVRSVTKVNGALLDGSNVRFVATATIGEDHLDKAYLDGHGIAYASAPGSNANSVAEYVVSALLRVADRFDFDLEGKTLGIVGVGNVGSRVIKKAEALGMRCILHDPPLADKTGAPCYRPMEELLSCDVLTFHVPLTKSEPYPTHHLVDEAFLKRVKPGAVIINSSRGAVVDGAALARAIASGHLLAAVLDVWEGEPDIDVGLLERVCLGTPHIAGYSFDGKVNGTRQICEAACRFLGIDASWDPAPWLPAPEVPEVHVDGNVTSIRKALSEAVYAIYDIAEDDQALRKLLNLPATDRPVHFDRLRKEYPRRREFHNIVARVHPDNPLLRARLAGLGFRGVES